jgi:hypothetical protein
MKWLDATTGNSDAINRRVTEHRDSIQIQNKMADARSTEKIINSIAAAGI